VVRELKIHIDIPPHANQSISYTVYLVSDPVIKKKINKTKILSQIMYTIEYIYTYYHTFNKQNNEFITNINDAIQFK
jgi:hypothetical protein